MHPGICLHFGGQTTSWDRTSLSKCLTVTIAMKTVCLLVLFAIASIDSFVREENKRTSLRLRHGPNKELILQRDVEAEDEEEDGLSIRRRCSCYCHSKAYHNDWDCCPCPWTDEVCFPGDTVLTLEDGTDVLMKNLKAGSRVMTVSVDGRMRFTEVKTFLKRQPTKSALYLTISTHAGPSLTLSGRHLVYVSSSNSTASMEPRFALSVKQGEFLFTVGNCGEVLCPALVTGIDPVVKEGVYVPLTEDGTLIVNDIFASCYSSINHHIAHAFTTPFRWFPWLLSAWQEDGFSPVVNWMKQFGHVILPYNLQFQDNGNSALPQMRIEL